MSRTLAGFKEFMEDAGGPGTRPDQKDDGTTKNMDSIDVQAMELGVDPQDFASVPDVLSNLQVGKRKILSGLSSWIPTKITDKTVTLTLSDEGNKRFIRTPSGVLAKDVSKQDTPKTKVIPRAYYDQIRNQIPYAPTGGGMGGMGGGIPPLT